MIRKTCSICGAIALPGTSRCHRHPKPPKRTGTYSRNAAKVRTSAVVCWICGSPFTDPNDPPLADHIRPRMYGGDDAWRTSRPLTARAMVAGARSSDRADAPGGADRFYYVAGIGEIKGRVTAGGDEQFQLVRV